MSKRPIKIEIVEENGERLLCKVFEDGTEERMLIVSGSTKRRVASRPYWYWELRTGRRKFF